jgi:hypothetical protein
MYKPPKDTFICQCGNEYHTIGWLVRHLNKHFKEAMNKKHKVEG